MLKFHEFSSCMLILIIAIVFHAPEVRLLMELCSSQAVAKRLRLRHCYLQRVVILINFEKNVFHSLARGHIN